MKTCEMMRDRLIELLDIIIQPGEKTMGDIADHLLTNGVIVPPCKVGDKLYYIAHRANGGKTEKYIKEEMVAMTSIDSRSIYAHIPRALLIDLGDLGKTVFLTREEAEKALAEKENNNDR